jgi:citrate lyase subunit beta/citryl-CoA lyase
MIMSPLNQGALARSYLFVPGDRPERFDKAWRSPADAIILDLEDAVAPDRKPWARGAISAWLNAARPVWIRCNAIGTAWFDEDLLLGRCEGVAGFFLPKAERLPRVLTDLARQRGFGLIPIVETAQGMRHAQALASAEGVVRLAFGSLDYQVDLGFEGDDDALLHARSQLVLSSRLAGKPPPIDGVTPSLTDEAQLQADTLRGRRLGLGAKFCIHPEQVDTVHRCLSPSPAERDWARRILESMNASADGVVVVEGKMVDAPVLMRARCRARPAGLMPPCGRRS